MSSKAREPDDNDDEDEDERPKKRVKSSFIEDAAEESGEEGGDVSYLLMGVMYVLSRVYWLEYKVFLLYMPCGVCLVVILSRRRNAIRNMYPTAPQQRYKKTSPISNTVRLKKAPRG